MNELQVAFVEEQHRMVKNCKSPDIFRLPNCVRHQYFEIDKMMIAMLGESNEMLLQIARSEILLPTHMLNGVREQMRTDLKLSKLIGSSSDESLVAFLTRISHAEQAAPIFTIDSRLNAELFNSDLSKGISNSLFQLPFPRFFLELGDGDFDNLLIGANRQKLEGCYISQISDVVAEFGQTCPGEKDCSVLGIKEGMLIRIIEILMVGKPVVGKHHPFEGYQTRMMIYLAPDTENVPLELSLDWAVKTDTTLGNTISEDTKAAFHQIVKALLYLNINGIRKEFKKERTDGEKSLSKVGSKKFEKRKRALKKKYDRIYIYAHTEQEYASSTDGKKVTPHLRRGHFHTVSYGKGHRLKRLDFFPPVIINKSEYDQITGDCIAAKTYRANHPNE